MPEPTFKRKMGRPKTTNARTERAVAALTEPELRAVERLAEQSGRTVSDWLRTLIQKEIGETK